MPADYDALLVVSFGGPEGPADVMPFLENVLRGKPVPRERMLEVAEHYQRFGGVSPINAQNRALIAALEDELKRHGIELPIYFGNRNWHPLLPAALRQMAADGVQRALAFFTSVASSYSGCRQYLENVAAAQAEVGPDAPRVDKLRAFYNHPGFIEAMTDRVRQAIAKLPPEGQARPQLVFTAHSIPLAMAVGCRYVEQLEEASRLVAQAVGAADFRLVYQSRSGPPSQPWLEPDVGDYLDELRARGATHAVVVPIGFISDHIEVLFDLDTEARATAEELGMTFVRAATVGMHPRFVAMIRELVEERIVPGAPALSVGRFGPSHDFCPADCCPAGRPAGGATAARPG